MRFSARIEGIIDCPPFTEHKKYVSYSAEAIQAYKRFKTIDIKDEMAPLNWHVALEETHNDLTLFVYGTMCVELNEGKTVIKLNHFELDAAEFLSRTRFCNVYWDHYYPKLEQSYTFTELEKDEKGNDEEFSDNTLSLTYHLSVMNLI